jgi:cysteine-rich repeat protein
MHETRTGLLTATLIVLTACPRDDAPSDDEVASETATETQGDTETTDDTTDTTDSTDAPDPMCGDGLVDAGEECDDGNDVDEDECTNACTTATCGDSIVQAGVETCDDGNVLDNDGCSSLCAIEECGDGIVQEGEECDDGDPSNGNECTTFCLNAFCGDGFLWIGTEQCDDGNMEDTDACVSGCLNAFCGDGFTEIGVEECDDANMDDTDACLTMCVAAICGDGITQVGVEECDDANMVDDDDCDNGCLLPVCGDGVVEGAEECDDTNADPLDGCSPTCTWESRLVFTTSSLHTGNLGGLVGADMICNMRAQEAGLPGTYMAWISTSRGTPASRFVHSTVPYLTTLGVKVADDWADLIDGSLDAPIQTTELMGPSPVGTNVCVVNNVPNNRTALTGTLSSGTLNGNNCSDFTSDVGMVGVGVSTSSTFRWTNCANLDCANTAALYCFQQ